MRIVRGAAVALLLLAFAGSGEATGQTGSGELSGRVLDAMRGEPVEGAVVTVTGPTEVTVLTNRDGRWTAGQVGAGEYVVSAAHLGFAEESLVVEVGQGGAEIALRLQARALPLEQVVVTASRREQRLADVAVATEVVTRADLERSGVGDLSQVLVERLGIQLDGGVPAGEGVMVQGLSSERVLVLVDGQPVVGRIGGNLDVSRLPLAAVERVEVVKGPQSSLYGSEAMGGVINVITRSPAAESWRGSFEMTAGTQGRADGSASLGGWLGGIGYVADVGRRMSELTPGRSSTQGAEVERWDALIKLAGDPRANLRADASLLLVDERQRWRSGQLYQFSDNLQWSGRAGAVWTHGAHRLTPGVAASSFTHLARSATSAVPVAGTGDEEVQRLLEAELLYAGDFGATQVDGGVEVKREEIESDRVAGGERSLYTVEPFAQATVNVGPASLVPGARLTVSEEWGTHFTPRIAAMLRPRPTLALRASVGRGYRAPSFKELGMEFLNVGAGSGYAVRGNPDLRPETSTNVSASIEWAGRLAYLRTQAFHNEFRGFIETRLVTDSSGIAIYTYDNIDDGFTRGVEVEGGFTAAGLRVEGGYALLEARDRETDLRLLNRPQHSGHLSLDTRLPGRVDLGTTATYTGRTEISRTEEGTVERSGFLRVDLRASRELTRGFALSVGARNLFDAEPTNWPGFGGRHVYVGLRWGASGDPQ